MRKVFAVCLAVVAMLLVAHPASAHHNDSNHYLDFGWHDHAPTWGNSGTEAYCIDQAFYDAYSAATMDNMEATTADGFFEWKEETDFNRSYANSLGHCPSNPNILADWAAANVTKSFGESRTEEFCQNYQVNANSRIEYENLDPGVDGMAIVCDRDNNELLDWFVIIIDVRSTWHFDQSQPTPNNPYSYWGLVTHEAGHVTGFQGHWADDSETCPDTTAGHNTMCDDGWGRFDGNGEAADAGIESHDIGEANQAY